MIDVLEKKHGILVTEFDRYVVEHPEFVRKFHKMLRLFYRLREMTNIIDGVGN